MVAPCFFFIYIFFIPPSLIKSKVAVAGGSGFYARPDRMLNSYLYFCLFFLLFTLPIWVVFFYFLHFFLFMIMLNKDCRSKSLSFYHLNVRSQMFNAGDEPSRLDLWVGNSFDIICLSETHLDREVESNEIVFEGYDLFKKDRNKFGGGVSCNHGQE